MRCYASSVAREIISFSVSSFFFFNDTPTTEIYTLSLHDALPIAASAARSSAPSAALWSPRFPSLRPRGSCGLAIGLGGISGGSWLARTRGRRGNIRAGSDGRRGARFRRDRRARGRRRLLRHCVLDLLLRAVQLPADLGDRIERGIALRLARHVVDLLLDVGQLRLAHRLLKLTLKFGGHAAQLVRPLPERAKHRGQLLRPDRDQRDDADDQ